MASAKLLKLFKKAVPANPCSTSNQQDIAGKITKTILKAGLSSLKNAPSFLYNLNSDIIHLVLLSPKLPTQSCLGFINFLRQDHLLVSFKPDLRAYMILISRLFKGRKFAEMKNILSVIAMDDNLQCPIMEMVLLASSVDNEPKFVEKLCDTLFRVYADCQRFDFGIHVFGYMVSNGMKIDGRSCIVFLLALKRCDKMEECLDFFKRMVESNAEVTVYSMTIVVDGLCKKGWIKRAMYVMIQMDCKGIKPNVVTYNTLLNAYIKRMDFEGVNKMLKLMEMREVVYNTTTYTLLIEWYGNSGKIAEADRVFKEMCERNIEADIIVYTSIISWNCKVGNLKRAFVLFDELSERGLAANAHTYGALIDGVCKAGQMEAAERLMNEMQSQGFDANQVIFNTLIDGYCRVGMIDEALKVRNIMEKKGFSSDVFTYNVIASGLFKLKRQDEAKRWLFTMIGQGLTPNVVNLTTLINMHCKEGNFVEAKRLFQDMEKKGLKPNVVTFNALIDGYCKKGMMKEAYKLRDKMEALGMMPDIYTYTSLIHGECSFGKLDEALRLFAKIRGKNLTTLSLATYAAMISGLSKEGRSEEAFKLYDEMIEAGFTPDDRVYTSLVGSLHKPSFKALTRSSPLDLQSGKMASGWVALSAPSKLKGDDVG
uniref:Pentatricopeptide repeat-containing protein n=1 Tax=Rhizophora mucronata TaxID=61149 RepID=A0A2P2NY29_RHIMU